MKATLTFMLPDEGPEFRDACQGQAAVSLLRDIDHHCRSLIKHSDLDRDTKNELDAIRRMIREDARVTLE